jgi:hypothetical protein
MAEPRWLSTEEMRAWQAFLAAGALLDRRLDQQLRQEAGLAHAQYEILVRLAAAPGGELRMSDLAGWRGRHPATSRRSGGCSSMC